MAKRLSDILADNAGKISLGLGALLGVTADYFLGEERKYIFPKEYASAMFGMAVSAMAFAYFKSLTAFKDPVFRNSFKVFLKSPVWLAKKAFFEEKKEYDKLISLLEESRPYFKSEAGIDLQIGSILVKKGDIEGAVESFKRFFQNFSSQRPPSWFFESVILAEKKYEAQIKMGNNPIDTENYFDLIDIGLRSGNIKAGAHYWSRLCDIELEERKDLNVLYAMFLDSLEKNKKNLQGKDVIMPAETKPKMQWEKSLSLILSEEGIEEKFRKIADSRNEVLEYGPSKFLRSTFVFKRGKNEEDLRKGYLVNLFLENLNQKIKLAKSLIFLPEHNGLAYDISRRKPLRNLEDLFNELTDAEKEPTLCEALANESIIHRASREIIKEAEEYHLSADGIEPVVLKRFDYIKALKRRLFDRLGINQSGIAFLSYLELDKYKEFVLSLINGDLAISNILEDGTVLDFEKAAIGNPMIDVITTLEDPKNGNVSREKIFREVYLRDYGTLEREFLEESYKPYAVFVSAYQVGSKTHQGDIKRAKGFAINVMEKSSSKVKDSFARYLRSLETEKARELQEVL
ncbi:hypothetical protein HYX16_05605 [Candidatus Woesearchaeota archaeon]|nr:hypothetical protein [Candidatus Woesearchaeota archaeon]